MNTLKGKVALITGAGSKTGEAAAHHLAHAGARLILTDINYEVVQNTSNAIGSQAIAIQHDVSSENSWLQVLETASNSFGHLHMLINGARINDESSIANIPFSEWQRIQRVNCNGVFLGCKHGLPLLEASGGGVLINPIIAAATLSGTSCAMEANYQAIRSLTKTIAAYCDERKSGVHCHTISCLNNVDKTADMLVFLANNFYTYPNGENFTETLFETKNRSQK